MTLKRKRSTTTPTPFSPASRFSCSSTSTSTSPGLAPSPQHTLSSALHSRTHKRVRNRPAEQTIHEHTLNKLFAAARNSSSPGPSSLASTARPTPSKQQATLHAFWNLPCAAPEVPQAKASTASESDDGMEMDGADMQVRGGEFQCRVCGGIMFGFFEEDGVECVRCDQPVCDWDFVEGEGGERMCRWCAF
ncbi:hypothetical protein EJ06DRAFT_527811 [Trichodelitschia bisporula]|uniref:Uncharacterized protein n=1 Tax=Trichodelitschia bisporula TaxID=703511 RepID=A0A6G1I3G4_9PEZI|nr:hypothetical protein EJ06DRAFT_527811 [Trichodelitschia bisporula]